MPRVEPGPSEHRGDGSEVVPADGVKDVDLVLDLPRSVFLWTSSPLKMNKKGTQQRGDGDQDCGRLDRRWVLWCEFMKEHAHLDAWLRLAEQAVTSHSPTHITYVAAKEELRKFERLRCEAGSRLVQLDGLTRRNRALTGLFQGVMRARLLGAARESGRRWDDVNNKLESIIARLTVFVSEWEEFEAEGEELALWLADLDVRLTEVDHLNGSTCEKLRRLQSFQECVCVNSSRVNELLQRGEALIQSSEQSDAQHVENRLLELLRRCSHIYNNIGRTHTRLLSMRLVFEDDWILSQATDSGCPSETLLEEESSLDQTTDRTEGTPRLPCPSEPVPPVPPPAPSSPTHEPQGLEWDPSVDIGRSVSCDDGDSSYFSAGTGVCLQTNVFIRSLSSQSDFGSDVVNHAENSKPGQRLDQNHPSVFSPPATKPDIDPRVRDQWATSTPEAQDTELGAFDGGRVREWLGVQGLSSQSRTSSCSKAVQTEEEVEVEAEDEWTFSEEPEHLVSEQRATPPLLYLYGAAALVLLAYLVWVSLETHPCHRRNGMRRSFHLALRYINGPPPL